MNNTPAFIFVSHMSTSLSGAQRTHHEIHITKKSFHDDSRSIITAFIFDGETEPHTDWDIIFDEFETGDSCITVPKYSRTGTEVVSFTMFGFGLIDLGRMAKRLAAPQLADLKTRLQPLGVTIDG